MNRFLLALATLAHLVPHPFGVSSVGATALYAGAYGPRRFSWAVPLIPLLLANLLFGFYDLRILAAVYAGFALATLAGRLFLANERNYKRYGAAVGMGAVIFYVVSNFPVWLVYYPQTSAGFVQCYINGLPYLGQAMLADAAYCFVLFGLHTIIERQKTTPALA